MWGSHLPAPKRSQHSITSRHVLLIVVFGASSRQPGSESSSDNEPPKVLSALSTTIERLVLRNENCFADYSTCRRKTVYHGTRLPNISIAKYLWRIHRYTCCSPSCFVVGFIYIDQLVHKQPDFPLIFLNIHRLLVTSIMVATKFLDDLHYNNEFYAKVGGISVSELNSLEVNFLFQLDFRLHVMLSTFEGYCTHLERELLSSEAGQRIERSQPSFLFYKDRQQDEKQKVIEDARKKQRLLMTVQSILEPS